MYYALNYEAPLSILFWQALSAGSNRDWPPKSLAEKAKPVLKRAYARTKTGTRSETGSARTSTGLLLIRVLTHTNPTRTNKGSCIIVMSPFWNYIRSYVEVAKIVETWKCEKKLYPVYVRVLGVLIYRPKGSNNWPKHPNSHSLLHNLFSVTPESLSLQLAICFARHPFDPLSSHMKQQNSSTGIDPRPYHLHCW